MNGHIKRSELKQATELIKKHSHEGVTKELLSKDRKTVKNGSRSVTGHFRPNSF